MNITFELSHQLIHRTDQNCLASGSRNYVHARFDLLTDDWTPPITAVFGDYSVILDSENQCLVPWEVLAIIKQKLEHPPLRLSVPLLAWHPGRRIFLTMHNG